MSGIIFLNFSNAHCNKLHFNYNLVDNQAVSYHIIPLYRAKIKATIVGSDYYHNDNEDIDKIQISYIVLASCKILNLFKYGNKAIAQYQVQNNKVCMDKVTSQLRFDLKPNKIYRNSHKIWTINGLFNYVNLFQQINEINRTHSISSNSLDLKNKNSTTIYDCRCLESIISNKVYTNNQEPSYFEPGRLSVNLGRPRVIASSQNSRETHLMGHLLIKVNPINGVNELINEKNVPFYSYDSLTVNYKPNADLFAIAGYDSCPNGGRISNLPSVILLSLKPLDDYSVQKNQVQFRDICWLGSGRILRLHT